jgi:hypothetical protein
VHRARRALSYRVPVVHGAAIFSAPLEDRQRGVRVVDRGQRPLPELVEQGRLIVPALEMATGWRVSTLSARFLDMIKLAEALRSTVAQLSAITIAYCEPPRSTSSRGN